MRTHYTNPESTLIELTLEPGESFENFVCEADATSPLVVPILTVPANALGDALVALIKAGGAPAPVSVLDEGAYAPPPPPATLDLVSYAKLARTTKEVGGITVAGVPIATDDRSKLLVAGARLRAQDNPNGQEMWAAADGNEYPLPAGSIILISQSIGAHVSKCFACFAEVKKGLAASPPTITDTAGIDEAFAAVPTAY